MGYKCEMFIVKEEVELYEKPEEFLAALVLEGIKFAVGVRAGQDPRSSPMGRHFTKTNVKRYGYRPLTAKYAKYKLGEVGNVPILVFTGALRDSVPATADCKIESVSDSQVTASATLDVPDYGPYHVEGGRNLPRRDWTMVVEDDNDAVAEEMEKVAQARFDALSNREPTHKVV